MSKVKYILTEEDKNTAHQLTISHLVDHYNAKLGTIGYLTKAHIEEMIKDHTEPKMMYCETYTKFQKSVHDSKVGTL